MFNNLQLLGEWPAAQAVETQWKARCLSGQGWKNCYLAFGNTWQVKLFLGREQRLLGQSHNGVTAARFADMAIVHFLQYRKRKLRPLTDADLNFSVAQANKDLAEMPTACNLLISFEQALLDRSLIKLTAVGEPAQRTPAQCRKDLSLHFNSLCATFDNVKHHMQSNDQAKVTLEMFGEHLEQARSYVRSLDMFLSTTPTLEKI
jgi:hypothetical protein